MAEIEYHAKLSPSSSDRWIKCPGSIAAQAAITEPDTGSAASRDGTAAHSLLQVCLLVGFDPQDFLGKVIDNTGLQIQQHMIDGVRVALEYVEEYVDLHGAKNVIVHAERRVHIGPMIGVSEEDCNGTSDLVIEHVDRSLLNVCDYKHGMKVVDAKDNPQLLLYTAGVVHDFDTKFKKYRTTIIQPRASKKHAVDWHDFGQTQLTAFLKKASAAAKIALRPDAPRSAGSHCFFCKAKSNCNEFRRRAMATAVDEFGELPDPEEIPADKMEEVLREASLLQAFIDAVKARALAMAQNGHKFSAYELGWGRRERMWDNVEDVVDWCKKNKLHQDEYLPRNLVSPSELEKLLKRRKLYPAKKRGQPAPESPITHLVTYGLPKPCLKERADGSQDFDEI